MRKAKQISDIIRDLIVTLNKHSHMNQKTIAAECGVSTQAVSRILKQYRSTGSASIAARTGRPRKTTSRDDQMILREVKRNPFITSAEIKQNLSQNLDDVTTRTIRSRLSNKFNMPARYRVRSPSSLKRHALSGCVGALLIVCEPPMIGNG